MRTIISSLPNRSRFRRGRYSIEIGYPWLSYGAIIAIELELRAEHCVLELGSGGSTIFWSKRCKEVKSYETDEKWFREVKGALPEKSNVRFVTGSPEDLVESIRHEPDEYYDWILGDIGYTYKFRFMMIKESIPKLKKNGFLIIDNYEEKNLMMFDYTNWDVYTFDDIGYHGRGTRICIKR